ncbi:hypothetical protein CDL12_09200 [Handroanthus impetiginosus]|uniref:2-phosphoglycerate kinase n=1 Tax=Handroanthus impetiginosus TaxID=429701 RepID=A0A2G9HKR6_9LAMI|nr:hypothetical protein CDL12_09200 [Handroanthus impetiginosus]
MAVPEGLTKLLYVVVLEDDAPPAAEKKEMPSFRYTRSVLQSTLQLMGCKPRHAFKISQRVFEMMRHANSVERLGSTCVGVSQQDDKVYSYRGTDYYIDACLDKADAYSLALEEDKSKSKSFELYKKRTTTVVRRKYFLDVVCEALSEYKYVGPNQRADLVIACRIRERKESVTVLLCGTSGCGKSTLSALLGSRLGITTIVSTDSIRHMMRSFVDEKQNPLLWASTYHAGEYLDPVAVAEAKAKKKAKKSAGIPAASLARHDVSNYVTGKSEGSDTTNDLISPKQMAVEGFKAQSEMVIDSLDRLITAWEKRKESVVVEGVHLSLNFVMGLMKKHPSIIPFMIYISNEEKHLERFAVRAKYMTLDPAKNKYVKYIRNIRTIQEYLCNRADKHLVPKINNTNVDKSVAVIHATVFSCLRRRETGEQLYDPVTNTVAVIDEEYRNQRTAYSLSSKGMFQLIQRQGSSRHLMALLNTDGSVAKAWPVDIIDDNGKPILGHPSRNGIGTPMYGPLQIGKAEPVNLQFGHFGISAWPSDTGGTSHASSFDDSRGELTDNGSRCFSSCCSSPRWSSKELKEELSVHGSDEEADESPKVDSDEDLSDGEKHLQEELEGSVDEESTKSDEEYDDLAMQDPPDNGYMSDDDDEEFYYRMELNGVLSVSGDLSNKNGLHAEKYQKNLTLFLRTTSEPLSEPLICSFASPLKEKSTRRLLPSGNKLRKRSHSIPAFGKHGSVMDVPNQ